MHSHQRNFRENFVMPESNLSGFNPMALGGRDADEGPAPKGMLLGGKNPNISLFIRNFKKMFPYRIENKEIAGIVGGIVGLCLIVGAIYYYSTKNNSSEVISSPQQYIFF
jgi:hypothetical protein